MKKVIQLTYKEFEALEEYTKYMHIHSQEIRNAMYLDAFIYNVCASPNQIVIINEVSFKNFLYDARKDLRSYVFRYKNEVTILKAIGRILKKLNK